MCHIWLGATDENCASEEVVSVKKSVSAEQIRRIRMEVLSHQYIAA